MYRLVLLLTESPAFESVWSAACRERDLPTRRIGFAELEGGAEINRPAAVIIDGASMARERAQLLSCIAIARSRGAVTALALDGYLADPALDDLYVELCAGLIARSDADAPRLASALRRRGERERDTRFEHLCTASSSHELLAVLGDASVVVVDRPSLPDDTTDFTVDSIQLAEDRQRATLKLTDGSEIELKADELLKTGSGNGSGSPAAPGDVDGVRLGQRLRALRLAAGLTQAELARRTGIHRPNIARVEAGRHTPSLETLARLAAAIGVSTTRVLAD